MGTAILTTTTTPVNFIHDLGWDDIPSMVRHQAKRCLLDTIGVAIGGRQTEASRIIYNHAAQVFGGSGGWLWFDGREVSMPGAVLAHGVTIDSLDLHDSCRPVKGHAGIAQIPTALATLGLNKAGKTDGQSLLTTLTMAYDIAIRVGTAQHATVCDYHTSGSWNAVGCAAVVARNLGLTFEQTRHALGIAEYHGPRSQMMRLIDHPSMLKDGSGWGAMAGVSAGLLAADGFTGAPALTIESDEAKPHWEDLGQEWSLMIQYFKPYAVCYWAQPAIAGALKLQKEHAIHIDHIASIEVYTFHESSRLATRYPTDTDGAQYSLPFPVAAALVHGQVMLEELSGNALHHPDVLRLSGLVKLIDDDRFNARFPAERISQVIIETTDGQRFDSGEVRPLWGLDSPPEDEDLLNKFRYLAHRYLKPNQADELEQAIWQIESMPDVSELGRMMAQS
ncbi:MAG: MmgE/PrpD family protein [Chloroflexota bacterium]